MIASDFLGYTAAVCTTLAFIPQALKVLREHDTRSLSLSMYVIFNVGVYLWAAYGFVKDDGALIGANLCTAVLSTAILIAKLRNVVINNEPT
jgi:MtN3 and saliva related transmembrane protein